MGRFMSSTVISQIEQNIFALPEEEQIRLIRRVTDTLRKRAEDVINFDAQLVAMANDPDIQRELKEIERDFRGTENDGLD